MSALILLVTGLAIGWLMGLSVTPVLNTVLTSLLSVVIAVVAIFVGLPGGPKQLLALIRPGADAEKRREEEKPPSAVSALPVMLLVVGIAVGATGGLATRANGWLLSERAKQGAGRTEIATDSSSYAADIGLYASPISAEACTRLNSQIGYPAQLKGEMMASGDPVLDAVAVSAAADSATLVAAVRLVCANRQD